MWVEKEIKEKDKFRGERYTDHRESKQMKEISGMQVWI